MEGKYQQKVRVKQGKIFKKEIKMSTYGCVKK